MPPPPHPRRTTAPQRTIASVWGVEIPMRRQGTLESCRRVSSRHAAEVNAREVTGASPGGNDVIHSIRRSWSRIRPSTSRCRTAQPPAINRASWDHADRMRGPKLSFGGVTPSLDAASFRASPDGGRWLRKRRLLLLGLESEHSCPDSKPTCYSGLDSHHELYQYTHTLALRRTVDLLRWTSSST